MKDLADLWNVVGQLLAAEDQRFEGLNLREVGFLEGEHQVEVFGPVLAVDLLLSKNQPINFRVLIRTVFRKVAEQLGGWEEELKSSNWPPFHLKGRSDLPDQVEDSEGEPMEVATAPPRHSSSVPPFLHAVDVVGTQAEAFRRIGREIGDLVAEKNRAYGNAFNTSGDALRILYPNGIAPEQYDDALAVVRIWDKLQRIATDRDALGESPFRDIAGYGILGVERSERSE